MPEPSSSDAGAPPRELAPVSSAERVLLLDVLRGLAMFGVLWSNLNDWYGTTDPVTGLQHALAWIQDGLIESRFYSLLGFLFGMGFAIQLTRAESRGVDVRAMFCRRMAALLGIGIIHGMADLARRYPDRLRAGRLTAGVFPAAFAACLSVVGGSAAGSFAI